MSKTTLNLRVDEDLKKEAEKVIKRLGLSTTACVTLFLKALVREKKIPFSISSESKRTTAITKERTVKTPSSITKDEESKKEKLSLAKAIELL